MHSSGAYAIWFSTYNDWMIGKASDCGSTTGYAYNRNNFNCPYDAIYDWKYNNRYNNWANAREGLSIWNKC